MKIIEEEWILKKKKLELDIKEVQQKIELNNLEIEEKSNKQKIVFPKEI